MPSYRWPFVFKKSQEHESDALNKATINSDYRAGEIGRLLAGQKCRDGAVFFRLAIASNGNGCDAFACDGIDRAPFTFGLLLVEEVDARRSDATRQDNVASHPVGTDLACQCF